VAALGGALLLGGGAGCAPAPPPPEPPPADYARMVSLAPGITEILFALGLGDRVAGVTDYCRFPPAARARPSVGGYMDPNLEAIERVRPDLLIVPEENRELVVRLRRRGPPLLVAPQLTLEDVYALIGRIGRAARVEDRAAALTADLRARAAAVAARAGDRPRPRALIAFGFASSGAADGTLFVAGRGTFHDDLLRAAGGENAYPDDGLKAPQLSAEGVLRLDPDFIFDLLPEADAAARAAAPEVWRRIPGLRAAREGRVIVLAGDQVLIPGPRFILTLEAIAAALDGGRPPEK